MSAYIPTNVISITDGQVRGVAKRGREGVSFLACVFEESFLHRSSLRLSYSTRVFVQPLM